MPNPLRTLFPALFADLPHPSSAEYQPIEMSIVNEKVLDDPELHRGISLDGAVEKPANVQSMFANAAAATGQSARVRVHTPDIANETQRRSTR